jgi:hypothetical protein
MNKSSTKPTPVEVLPPEPEAPVPLELSVRLQKKLQAVPIQVQGTWDAARRWLSHARYMQEAALYCQVMLGFELIALRESIGETRGRRPANSSHDGKNFVETAQAETGLGTGTIYRFIGMAEASVTRLKGLPSLRNFDPTLTPLSLLPDAQKTALSSAVRKMTDGMTQADFMVELGLAKAPQGSGATGGARERKPSDPMSSEEQAEAERTIAREGFRKAMLSLATSGKRFTLLPDPEIREQIAWIEHHLSTMKSWISRPYGQRDPAEVEKAFQDLLMGNLHDAR